MMANGERTALDAGFQIIIPVWGESYTSFFAEVCLPTLMAPGNIPALPYPERHVFAIYTTPEDRRLIEAAPVFARLAASIRVEFHAVRARLPYIFNSYDIQSDCFRRAIRRADAADQAMVFLTPDLIMANGSLRGLARVASTGARAVLGVGIRLSKARVRDHLLAHHLSADGCTIAIAPREAARLALTTLHPIAKDHMFHGEGGDLLPSNLYWRVGEEGLLAHCFHLHPFLIYPRIKNARFSNTVDGDYIEAACPDPADTYIITDSDELSAWELSDPSQRVPTVSRSEPGAIAAWMREWTTPRHRTLINTGIRIHSGVADYSLWQRTEHKAKAGVADLMSLIADEGITGKVRNPGGVTVAGPTKTPVRFITVIRTANEAENFVDIALPSVLAPANIAAQLDKQHYTYKIVTTVDARPIVESSSIFAELCEHVRVDVETRNALVVGRDDLISTLRFEAIAAGAEGYAALFIDPDSVLADHSLPIIRKHLRSNMRAVLIPRLRLRRSTAAPALRQKYYLDGIISIMHHELVRFALDHLHPLARSQFCDGDADRIDPVTLCWRVGNEGVLVHAFDYHPLLVHARPSGSKTVDHPFLGGLGFGADEITLIRDSRALVQCQLSDDDVAAPHLLRDGSSSIASWAAANAGAFHQILIRNQARLFATREQSELWNTVSAAAATAVNQVLSGIDAARQAQRRA